MSGKSSPAKASEFVFCADGEEEDANKMELTTEDDGSLSLNQLSSAFPGATGLKFKNPKTGAYRVVALDSAGSHFLPPNGDWGETMYMVIKKDEKPAESSKRKIKSDNGVEDDDNAKYRRLADAAADNGTSNKCIDLLVLSLPFTLDSEGLKAHFEQFGKVAQAEIKNDHTTGRPRGFGFVRMEDYEAQLAVLDKSEHDIGGRSCTVKIPWDKKDEKSFVTSPKIFVGRVTEQMTMDDIKTLFEEEAKKIDPHGHVTDVFIPKPFRAFAFVTFNKIEVTQQILKKEHFRCLDSPVFAGPAVRKTPGAGPSMGGAGGAYNKQPQQQQQAYGYGAPAAYNQWPQQQAVAGYHSGTYGTSQHGAAGMTAPTQAWGDAYAYQAMTNQQQLPPYNGPEPAAAAPSASAAAPSYDLDASTTAPVTPAVIPESQMAAQKHMHLPGVQQDVVNTAWQAFWHTINHNNPASTPAGVSTANLPAPPGTRR